MTVPETPSPLDLDRLEALAAEFDRTTSSGNEWHASFNRDEGQWEIGDEPDGEGAVLATVYSCGMPGHSARALGQFIAAVPPEVVRALVSEARIGRLAIDARRKQLAWENCDPAKSGEFFRPYEAAEKALETAIEEADRAR